MANIHPTAIVADSTQLADDIQVGPYSVIHEHAQIGAGTVIGAHSIVHSYVKLGERNQIADHVVLGGAPQDISYQGEETWLEIGDDNQIREFTSIHRSNSQEEKTTVGNNCFLMANIHIGHNCQIGNEVIITTYAGLSGHIEVGDKAVIGGSAAIHQFCRIGPYAMVSGFAPVSKDVMPFCLLGRDPVIHYRLNSVGLRRAGIKGDRYRALEKAIRKLRNDDDLPFETRTPEIELLQTWLAAPSKRGVYKFLR